MNNKHSRLMLWICLGLGVILLGLVLALLLIRPETPPASGNTSQTDTVAVFAPSGGNTTEGSGETDPASQTTGTETAGKESSSTQTDGAESSSTETDGAESSSTETDGTETADSSFTQTEDTEPPPSVTVPTETDPESHDPEPITFPCRIPEYDLVIQRLAPYDGMYVEDGSNTPVVGVAMILVTNEGAKPVEYCKIQIALENETLEFDLSALPVGESAVVQEKNGKAFADLEAFGCSALVVRRAEMSLSESMVRVTDNGDNTLTVENLTGETIPTVRIFYKYYMKDESVFVGGIAFTAKLTRLGPGDRMTIQPSHYTSDASKVVMVLTYAE